MRLHNFETIDFTMDILKVFSIIAIIGFAGIAVFQFLLALGFPLGRASWGGKYTALPVKLRIASFVSIGVLVFGILVILEKANFITLMNSPRLVSFSCWGLTILFGLSTIGNINSKSKLEKQIMTPIASILFLSCLAVSVLS